MNQDEYDVQQAKLDQAKAETGEAETLDAETGEAEIVVYDMLWYPIIEEELRADLAVGYVNPDADVPEIIIGRCVIKKIDNRKGKKSKERISIDYTVTDENDTDKHVKTTCGIGNLYIYRLPRTSKEEKAQDDEREASDQEEEEEEQSNEDDE